MNKNMGFMASVLMIFALVVVLVVYPTGFDFVDEYIQLIPSIILVFAGIYSAKSDGNGVVKTGACLASGVGFAYMTGTLNTMGILIPDLLTPALTLPYLQLLIIVLFGIVGVVISSE